MADSPFSMNFTERGIIRSRDILNELLQLKPEISIIQFDTAEKNSYLISFNNRNWKVSSIVYIICSQIKDTPTTAQQLMEKNIDNIQLNEKCIKDVLEFLTSNGMLIGTEAKKSPEKRNHYLWARITVFPANVVEKFNFLSILFKTPFFITLGTICLAFFVFIMLTHSSAEVSATIQALNINNYIPFFIIVLLIGLFHEFGHSAALMHFNETPRRIGVAVYFIMPVLFSDVTNAWKLKKWQRCIVDLGGIYFQLILSFVLYIVNYCWLKIPLLETAIIFSMLEVINNLNPFIRMDGFWLVCDALGISSPLKFLFAFITNPFRKNKNLQFQSFSTIYKIIIYAYAIATIVFLTYFFSILVNSTQIAISYVLGDILKLINEYDNINFTFGNAIEYFSKRFTTFIILFFMARLVIKGISVLIKLFFDKKWHSKKLK